MSDGPDIVINGVGPDRDQDDLTLIVGGTEITGWQEIEVTLRAEGFPNSFHIALSSKEPISTIVRAGEICTVLLGRDKVITGYIDRDVPGGTPNTHVINVLGRGLTQDLVDCSAEWPQGQLTQADALTIASTRSNVCAACVIRSPISEAKLGDCASASRSCKGTLKRELRTGGWACGVGVRTCEEFRGSL